jgi:zinc D-Ala-D-Ala carboxypeptidase
MSKLLTFTFLMWQLISIGQIVTLSEDELLGKIDPAADTSFTQIAAQYTSKNNIYLRKEAYDAFVRMEEEAAKAGIQLNIISATRNFDYQKGIWERKWQRSKYMGWQEVEKVKDIMQYSSMPGTSRHHWGTDIDLNSLNNTYFESGKGANDYNWLKANAERFGYYQVYAKKDSGRTGYSDEKWHWSYMPLASQFLEQYNQLVTNESIQGFSGSDAAIKIDAVKTYVNGIYKGNE